MTAPSEKDNNSDQSKSIGGILRKAGDIFARNMNIVAPLVLLMTLPSILIEVAVRDSFGDDNFGSLSNPFDTTASSTISTDDVNIGFVAISLVLGLVISIVVSIITLVASHRLAKGETEITLGSAWVSGRARIGTLIVAGILYGILVMLGLILLVLPGLIIAALLSLTWAVIVDRDDMGAIESMKESKRLFMSRVSLPLTWYVTSFAISMLFGIVNAPLVALSDELGIIGSVAQNLLGNALSIFLLIGYMLVFFALKDIAGSSSNDDDVYSS